MSFTNGDLVRPFPATAYFHDDTVLENIENTSYEAGSPEVGVYFVAPPSGVVRLTVGAGIRESGATNGDRVFVSPAVYEVTPGGLVTVLSPSVTFRGYGSSEVVNRYAYGCRVSLVTGLRPGALHYARLMHLTSAGTDPDTADIAARDLIVIPMP